MCSRGPCITFVTRAEDVDVDMFPEVLNVSLSVALSQTVGHHPGDSGLALAGVPDSQVGVLSPEARHEALQFFPFRMIFLSFHSAVGKLYRGVPPEADGPVEKVVVIIWLESVEVCGRLYLPEYVLLSR